MSSRAYASLRTKVEVKFKIEYAIKLLLFQDAVNHLSQFCATIDTKLNAKKEPKDMRLIGTHSIFCLFHTNS